MKKQLLLLVSLLLPLISGCGSQVSEEPTLEIVYNYKESEYSQHLNAIKYSGLLRNDPLEDFILEQNYISVLIFYKT